MGDKELSGLQLVIRVANLACSQMTGTAFVEYVSNYKHWQALLRKKRAVLKTKAKIRMVMQTRPKLAAGDAVHEGASCQSRRL